MISGEEQRGKGGCWYQPTSPQSPVAWSTAKNWQLSWPETTKSLCALSSTKKLTLSEEATLCATETDTLPRSMWSLGPGAVAFLHTHAADTRATAALGELYPGPYNR